ncbi:nucleotide cyclase, partial [Ochromonadaceae sp. CCMP2298]
MEASLAGEDPAIILHKWLRRHHHRQTGDKIEEVSELIRLLLAHTSDPIFVNLLIKVNWDLKEQRFGKTYPVNLDALQQALANKSRCFSSQDTLRSLKVQRVLVEEARDAVSGQIAGAAELIAGRSFVPGLLLHHASLSINEGRRVLKPHSQFMQGVCLLVDISGFTKMSAAFCAKGTDGIDGLQRTTNNYMGRLVEVIYSYEGDIIKFAGDAIICVFLPPDDEVNHHIATSPKTRARAKRLNSFAQMVLSACECALELREVEMDRLTVHVGLSCGEICFGVLGGHENRWECLISGPCIESLSQCLDDAPSGQAVCTPACFKALQQPLPKHMHTAESGEPSPANTHTHATYASCISTELLDSGNYRLLDLVDKLSEVAEIQLSNSEKRTPTIDLTPTVDLTPLPTWERPILLSQSPSIEDLDQYSEEMAVRPNINSSANFVEMEEGLAHSSAGLTSLGEIREVTTMFVKFDSYDNVQ